jgi:hypothetical protein
MQFCAEMSICCAEDLKQKFQIVTSIYVPPMVHTSTLLKSYLAPARELAGTNEFEACTGGNLVAGTATSVGQVLGKRPDGNGRLTGQVIQ